MSVKQMGKGEQKAKYNELVTAVAKVEEQIRDAKSAYEADQLEEQLAKLKLNAERAAMKVEIKPTKGRKGNSPVLYFYFMWKVFSENYTYPHKGTYLNELSLKYYDGNYPFRADELNEVVAYLKLFLETYLEETVYDLEHAGFSPFQPRDFIRTQMLIDTLTGTFRIQFEEAKDVNKIVLQELFVIFKDKFKEEYDGVYKEEVVRKLDAIDTNFKKIVWPYDTGPADGFYPKTLDKEFWDIWMLRFGTGMVGVGAAGVGAAGVGAAGVGALSRSRSRTRSWTTSPRRSRSRSRSTSPRRSRSRSRSRSTGPRRSRSRSRSTSPRRSPSPRGGARGAQMKYTPKKRRKSKRSTRKKRKSKRSTRRKRRSRRTRKTKRSTRRKRRSTRKKRRSTSRKRRSSRKKRTREKKVGKMDGEGGSDNIIFEVSKICLPEKLGIIVKINGEEIKHSYYPIPIEEPTTFQGQMEMQTIAKFLTILFTFFYFESMQLLETSRGASIEFNPGQIELESHILAFKDENSKCLEIMVDSALSDIHFWQICLNVFWELLEDDDIVGPIFSNFFDKLLEALKKVALFDHLNSNMDGIRDHVHKLTPGAGDYDGTKIKVVAKEPLAPARLFPPDPGEQ